LIAAVSTVDRLVLAEHDHLEVAFQVAQHVLVGSSTLLGRDARHLGDDGLDSSAHRSRLLALVLRQQALARAGLVDHVDGLVRQVAVVDVRADSSTAELQRLDGVLDVVVLLEARLQPCRISMVSSSTLGSTTSIFWKRRASARSFSKMPRYSW
jgi:hypothetical protein